MTGRRLLFLVFLLVLPSAAEAGPRKCDTKEAKQFDFWIGEWDVSNRQRNPQKQDDPQFFDTGTLRSRVYAINDGCAIVEHAEGKLSWGQVHGFSLRAYDENRKAWVVISNWPSTLSPAPVFGEVSGNFRHGRGEMHSATPNAMWKANRTRFTFSDLRPGEWNPESFRWDMAVSSDDGLNWRDVWIMELTRRKRETRRGVLAGPAALGAAPLCKEEEHRAADFLTGRFVEQIAEKTPGTQRLHIETVPILGGCASMTFMADGTLKSFRVRAYDPAKKEWVQYVSTNRPGGRLIRSEGARDGASLVLTTPGKVAGGFTRETWTPEPGGDVRYQRSTSKDGKRWRTQRKIRFTSE